MTIGNDVIGEDHRQDIALETCRAAAKLASGAVIVDILIDGGAALHDQVLFEHVACPPPIGRSHNGKSCNGGWCTRHIPQECGTIDMIEENNPPPSSGTR